MNGHEKRLARIVGGVLAQALDDARADSLMVLDPESPEGRLLRLWAGRMLGADRVQASSSAERTGTGATDGIDDAAQQAELHRMKARLASRRSRSLLAHPANKTALLLGSDFPPEPLLPLGDLYASRVEALAGGWTAEPAVRTLAERAGGIHMLDDALRRRLERREPVESAFRALPGDVSGDIIERLEAGRFNRRIAGIVPKLGHRTLGIDLLG